MESTYPLVRFAGIKDGRPFWRLAEDWSYTSELLKPWLGVMPLFIPAGTYTDFASVPRFALSLVGNVGWVAALPHDWIYQTHQMFQDKDETPIPRIVVDLVFHEAMGIYGPHDWRRHAMYHSVRLGGWKAWTAHEQRVLTLNPKQARRMGIS